MLRNKLTTAFAVAALLVAASAAHAITTITNTATANFNNSAATPQTAVTGSTTFTAESDPVLEVVKTGDKASGPAGTVVTWTIRVAYPRVADVPLVCGDDSAATSVVITDAIPAGFTYVGDSTNVSDDDGSTWTPVADGASGIGFTVNYSSPTLTVNTPDLVEGQGDTVNCGASPDALVIRFQATKN